MRAKLSKIAVMRVQTADFKLIEREAARRGIPQSALLREMVEPRLRRLRSRSQSGPKQ